MFKRIAFVAVCAVLVQADPVPFKCGEYPWRIMQCITFPVVIKEEIVDQCQAQVRAQLKAVVTECEHSICMYRKLGWMNEEVIDYSKVAAYFGEFAKKYPLWADAVAVVKAECLVGNLPALGILRNCPTYDINQCITARFFKNTKPSQWKTDAECEILRQYVANCPICPTGCVAPYPEGLCNQCKA